LGGKPRTEIPRGDARGEKVASLKKRKRKTNPRANRKGSQKTGKRGPLKVKGVFGEDKERRVDGSLEI